jgi:hypothetical protein
MAAPTKKNGTTGTKKKMRTVQSGIGISSLNKTGAVATSAEQSFLTSRTARVLLAGAGFLADAVKLLLFSCNNTTSPLELLN